jgi:hypothetical protein
VITFQINWGGKSPQGWYLDYSRVVLSKDDGLNDCSVFFNWDYWDDDIPGWGLTAYIAESKFESYGYSCLSYLSNEDLQEEEFQEDADWGDVLWVDSHGLLGENSVILYWYNHPEHSDESQLLGYSDITDCWNSDLEWVFFLVCDLFTGEPNGWKQRALKHGVHGIYGAIDVLNVSTYLPLMFFEHAFDDCWTIRKAWFETLLYHNQWPEAAYHEHNKHDHFWGYGSTAGDCHCKLNSDPFDDDLVWEDWIDYTQE